MNSHTNLTAKQARFVAEYLVDGNGAQAAIRAGYGAASAKVAACRLLTKDNVQAALQTRQQADAVRLSLSRDHVVAGLREAVETARTQRNAMAMISGWREIGRMLGFFGKETPSRNSRAAAALQLHGDVATASDAQLLAWLESRAKTAAGVLRGAY